MLKNLSFSSAKAGRCATLGADTWSLTGAFVTVLACALFLPGVAAAAAGDVLRLGTTAAPVTLVDAKSGISYQLFFEAMEVSAGRGSTTIGMSGGQMRVCSTHGPGIDFSGTDFAYSGNMPFASIQCGTSYGQSVVINGCRATVEAHGFMHSDAPNLAHLGSTSIAIDFKKSTTLKITIGGAELSGRITAGDVTMNTCQ